MLVRNIKLFSTYTIHATDGDIGKVHDFMFDDHTWTIRYLVIDTGRWLPGRKVLISPESVTHSDWENRAFSLNLTKEQIKESPRIDLGRPITLKRQTELHDYYRWSYYWSLEDYPPASRLHRTSIPEEEQKSLERPTTGEIALEESDVKSINEVIGYHIQAEDAEIGHVEDFLVEDEQWRIHYVIVDTRNWLPGKKVLIAPDWIEKVNWAESKVHVKLAKEAIKTSPEYQPTEHLNPEYEDKLYEHYGLKKHWRLEEQEQ